MKTSNDQPEAEADGRPSEGTARARSVPVSTGDKRERERREKREAREQDARLRLSLMLTFIRMRFPSLWSEDELASIQLAHEAAVESQARASEAENRAFRIVIPLFALLSVLGGVAIVALASNHLADSSLAATSTIIATALIALGVGVVVMVWLSDRLTEVTWIVGIVLATGITAAWILLPETPGFTSLALLLAASIVVLEALLGWVLSVTAIPWLTRHQPYDAWDMLLLRLTNALHVLDFSDFCTSVETRKRFGKEIGRAAYFARRSLSPPIFRPLWLDADVARSARESAEAVGRVIANHQVLMTFYGTDALERTAESLGAACLAVVKRDMSAFQDKGEPRRGSWLRQNSVRLAAFSSLVALGVLVGFVLPDLTSDELVQLRLSIGIAAILSLFSPAEGWKAVGGAMPKQ